MPPDQIAGWLFDAYPDGDGIRVWLIDDDGNHRSVFDPWRYPLYFHAGGAAAAARAQALISAARFPVSLRTVERMELFSGETLSVVEARVHIGARDQLVKQIKRLGLALFNADVHAVQAYHYDRGHFPLARCTASVRDGTVVGWEVDDDPWSVDYELPPLRTMHLALAPFDVAGKLDPNHAPRGKILLKMEGRTHELEGRMAEQIEALNSRLKGWDPDVITTDWGDSFLVPGLEAEAARLKLQIAWSRDPKHQIGARRERSFFTYGRAVYQGGARYLFGRWHLDVQNSFGLREYGTDGLYETARIAAIPVQRAARCTIGTALSSMQMAYAWRQGILVPYEKQQAESFRPSDELLEADKGGLVFKPDIGWHENIAELDFVSMYPTVMVKQNISPETVNCVCCPDNKVPGTRHHLCRRRRGLVPAVLEPILAKRVRYKALAKEGGPRAQSFKRRAAAHKWILVVAFGYQGYRNAKFGKIESHECVTAWGREVLLLAKEEAERRGLHILHANTDAIWVQLQPGADVEGLRLAVESAAGCPLALEGVYKWIRFLPSKGDPRTGVPNRYFGAFMDGELKIRGIAYRRHDTPRLLKKLQEDLLGHLARQKDVASCRADLPALVDQVDDYRLRLKEGRVSAAELAITFTLSREPGDYVADTVASLSAKQLAASGVTLHVGESVSYVITAAKDKIKEYRSKPLSFLEEGLDYDVKKYLELLDRAAAEVLDGLGGEDPGVTPGRTKPQLELDLGIEVN